MRDLLDSLQFLINWAEEQDNKEYASCAVHTIITCLRGPDNNDNQVKAMTVARLRALLLGAKEGDLDDLTDASAEFPGCYYVEGWLVRWKPLNKREQKLWEKLLYSTNVASHFAVHWLRAIRAAQAIYGYNLATEKRGRLSLDDFYKGLDRPYGTLGYRIR
jgi:hypothetical protein